MAGNPFLQNPENIGTGWAPEPQLHAPDIGSTLGAILRNRQVQQALQQENIANAVKQIQSQRSDQAYIQAAQNAGVLPQGDLSGMTAAQASNLAQRIQDQQQTSQEKYYDALTNILNTTGRRPPTGPLSSGGQRPMTQGQAFNALKTQAGILGSQADELAQQQEDYGLPAEVGPAAHGYVMDPGGTMRYAKPGETPTLVSSGDPLDPKLKVPITDPNTNKVSYPPVPPIFTPEVYKQRQEQSKSRQDILAEKIRVQQQMLKPQDVSQNDVDQASQAQGLTAGPSAPPPADTSTPPPSGGGTGPKVASGYGVKAVYMKAPDGTVSPVDPNLVEYYKNKGAVIVQGP